MKTSEVIRNGINKAWEHHNALLREDWSTLADAQREAIRLMEKDYARAVKRERREARR